MTDAHEIADLEMTELADLIQRRLVSSVDATEAVLSRIDALDPQLQSYREVHRESALDTARRADRELEAGRSAGPLHGIPIAMKDLVYMREGTTTSGMPIHRDFRPGYDASVVARLRAAGAVIVGKLRLTEGATAWHHPDLQVPVNPWDPETWSGVSSSGSGVAVAAGLCYGATGTDTGGSIRFPSAANGVTGLKPTWGRVSRHGVAPLAPSLDTVGPMARSARDVAVLLGAMAGADPSDPTTSLEPVPDYAGQIDLDRRPRVGIDWEAVAGFDAVTVAMLTAVLDVIRAASWPVIDVRLPELTSINRIVNEVIYPVEAAASHRETFPSRAAEYGPDLRDILDRGMSITATAYHLAMTERQRFSGALARVFERADIVLMPATGHPSVTNRELATLDIDARYLQCLPAVPFSASGNPSLTLPAYFTERGTPVGVQFIGRHFSEDVLLQAGHAFQKRTDFHRKRPSSFALRT